jgi:alanyl-tRNA synthetase
MTEAEIRAVEDLANSVVLQNFAVETHLMRPDEAIARGALALFGEKYGEEVRVVSMGRSEQSEKADHAYSIELCGGTHVRRTGDVGLFKIVGESAVASGVRRIEALTGEGARSYLATQDQRVREAAELLKVGPDEMIERLTAVLDERRKLERQLADAKRELALTQSKIEMHQSTSAEDQISTHIISTIVSDVAPKDLRGMIDAYKTSIGDGVVTVISTTNDKASFAVGVAGSYATANNASSIAEKISEVLGGKSGGRVDFAQGGGPKVERVNEARELVFTLVRKP